MSKKTLQWWNEYSATIRSIFNVPFLTQMLDMSSSDIYDLYFYGNNDRCYRFVNWESENLDNFDNMLPRIVQTFISNRQYKYKTLYDTQYYEYNAIENYSMIENTNSNNTTNNLVHNNIDLYSTSNNTVNSTNSQSAVNADVFYNTDKNDVLGENTTHNYSGDDNTTTQSMTTINSNTLTRKGNIGTMSTQNMIEQERKIANFSFLEILFEDIDKLILLNLYGE